MAKDKLPGAYLMTEEDGTTWDEENPVQSLCNSVRWCMTNVRRRVRRTEGMTDEAYAAAQEVACPLEGRTLRDAADDHQRVRTAGIDVGSAAYMASTRIAIIDKNHCKLVRSCIEKKLADAQVMEHHLQGGKVDATKNQATSGRR
jgi:hypothetical protein